MAVACLIFVSTLKGRLVPASRSICTDSYSMRDNMMTWYRCWTVPWPHKKTLVHHLIDLGLLEFSRSSATATVTIIEGVDFSIFVLLVACSIHWLICSKYLPAARTSPSPLWPDCIRIFVDACAVPDRRPHVNVLRQEQRSSPRQPYHLLPLDRDVSTVGLKCAECLFWPYFRVSLGRNF